SGHDGVAIVPVAPLTGLKLPVARREGEFASALAAGCVIEFGGGGHGELLFPAMLPYIFVSCSPYSMPGHKISQFTGGTEARLKRRSWSRTASRHARPSTPPRVRGCRAATGGSPASARRTRQAGRHATRRGKPTCSGECGPKP